MTKLKERFFTALFAVNAVFSVLAVLMICLFLFANALPTMSKIGFVEFIFGFEWFPSEELFGIFAMIIGSLYVTALAIFIGVPLGVLSAIYLSCFCHKRLKKFLMPCVELLGAIPSVVYGFFGLVVIVPTLSSLYGGISGKGILAASLVLAIMILPTIILLSKAAIDALPKSYYEGALALGASKERSVFFALVPAAKSGILASVILGVGRAIGEAMAVMMVAGNSPNMPDSLFRSVTLLTTAIAKEMSYAGGLQRQALFSIALVLFVFIMLINVVLNVVLKGGNRDE